MLSVAQTAREATLKDGEAGGIDPQTATDLSNERLVLSTLKETFPSHACIGEETVAAANNVMPKIDGATPTWIVDPIDGTQNFTTGLPLSVVSIGLCLHGKPALGVIYDPYRDELFVGISSEASYCNGVRMRAERSVTTLEKAMVLTDVGYERSAVGARRIAQCHEALLNANTYGIRIVGSTVLMLAWLAHGRAHAAYIGLGKKDTPKAWDWCAAWAIGQACGVTYTRLASEEPFGLDSTSVVAAGNEKLCATLRDKLRGAVAGK